MMLQILQEHLCVRGHWTLSADHDFLSKRQRWLLTRQGAAFTLPVVSKSGYDGQNQSGERVKELPLIVASLPLYQ
ncbi:hypothetical protein [Spirosoma oryzicola]|uniref:hypothetical protein n=1 Tax=Spirosoma oryzicola TaxID=2898794 RepID=UPI001E4665DF|nr:hypothetical protein [Spirosoma oryzicola]UHG90455.1 hypothetical protein LQ777_19650 [Spirosoma oryzicola]